MNKEKKGKNTILIVGDWVVDENWFLVRHHSDISSHAGLVHYRLACDKTDIVFSLGGAGNVARVFYQLRYEKNENYQLIGLGKWHEDDTEFFRHLIHSRVPNEGKHCYSASASFIIKQQLCKIEPNIKLITLKKDSPTIRVVRLYHQEDGGIEQINRVDWEPERKQKDEENYKMDELEIPKEEQVEFIVINDFKKGVVTEKLIKSLRKMYPEARWFVKSRNRKPVWLDTISESLELFLIGPEVASLISPWDNWMKSGRLTDISIEVIKTLPYKNVALISSGYEVLVRSNNKCITGKSGNIPTHITNVGWSSAFFAYLVYSAYRKNGDFDENDVENAFKWLDEYGGFPLPRKSSVIKVEKSDRYTKHYELNEEVNRWEQARKNFGFIKDKDELRLEVWRGYTQLQGYISIIEEKQEIIYRIGRHIRNFATIESPPRSLSIILQADPGSGKTLLAKSLAKAFDFSFIQYDVTQMIHRDEILDLFDNVATRQANIKGKVLVFVDEINALLDGVHAYGAFLAPLEEGIYIRRGKYFSLKPCVWIFAGTKLEDEALSAGEKLSDFRSRMVLIEKIDFKSLKSKCKDTSNLQNQARLEQVYLGATLVKRYYSDVQEISMEVLKQFYILDPGDAPARKIRKMATSLRNVQYGRITRKNCSNWENVHWTHKEEEDQMVKIIFE